MIKLVVMMKLVTVGMSLCVLVSGRNGRQVMHMHERVCAHCQTLRNFLYNVNQPMLRRQSPCRPSQPRTDQACLDTCKTVRSFRAHNHVRFPRQAVANT
mmetsp:Transcript_26900/g.79856  ORF Transcript_26900/g.79856 Transcript_26900/m.79856 type:complete len:99 (-) Transcript_26900:2339-2635(-)